VGELKIAHASSDLPKFGAAAHKLKSSSRAVGAAALADVCADIENACRSGALLVAGHRVADAARLFAEVEVAASTASYGG
jgi:HPt (histidine-containing phosphotransfer) domain-containing protein